jgi:hypothetical protein
MNHREHGVNFISVNDVSTANFKIIFRRLVAYLIFYRFWCFFFYQETHMQWPQKVNLWGASLGVHITGPFLFIIILIILLFDHFRDRLLFSSC